jgi:caffeoyl-CoA O-methyltransferase
MTTEIPPVDVGLMRPQVTAAAEAWADAFTTAPSADVLSVRTDTQTRAPVPQMISGIKEARLLEALVLTSGAKRILEVGTFTGATTLSLAEILPPDARITTLEREEAMAAIAQAHFESSPAGAKIELRVGDARSAVHELDGPFDLIFIDAWKVHYVDYYEALLPKLAPSGLIVADDVVWGGMPFNDDATDVESEGIRRFVRHVQDDPRVHNVLLTVAEGLLLIWHAPNPTGAPGG